MTPPEFDVGGLSLPPLPARIHFVGIGGAGVSGLARIALDIGYVVTGTDSQSSSSTDELSGLGARVWIGHDESYVAGAALVVATAAVRGDNSEIAAAKRVGIPVVKRAALLGLLSSRRACLAVAGTHGKSTTSGMAALALQRAGLSPSYAVGATVPALGNNAALGSGPHFVVEADEYDYSFLWLRPSVAIITNIEYDHPDLFPDRTAVLDAFARFVGGIRPGGSLVIRADDPGCRELLGRLRVANDLKVVTFGRGEGDWRISDAAAGVARVSDPRGQSTDLRLRVPGRHNLLNALSVLAAADGLGVGPERLLPGLQEFGGVSRRFEVLRDSAGCTVIDDYAHHPTEIAATIAAARERFPSRRLVVTFQPHTFSRTLALVEEFAEALDLADAVVLAEIYASRETDTLGVSSADVGRRMRRRPTQVETPQDAATAVLAIAEAGDVILVMGAGDITLAATTIVAGFGL